MNKLNEILDLTQCPTPNIFAEVEYPWEVLPRIEDACREYISQLDDTYREISPNVYVGEGTTIAPTALIEGPTVIGRNCEIRHGAYIRGKAIVGDGVVIGNSSEVKNALIFNGAQIPHFNYVGDAVMGYKSHIGAGVKLSNLKSDKSLITIMVDGQIIETGLKKFGAIIGDYVEVGCNAVLNPGTVIGRASNIYPLTNVRGIIPSNVIVKSNGQIVVKR